VVPSIICKVKEPMGVFDFFKKKPTTPEATVVTETAAPAGFFQRLKTALKRTTALLNTDIRDLFKSEGRLVDEDFLRELFAILVRTDMGVKCAGEIRDRVATDFRGRVVHMQEVLATVKAKIRELMSQTEEPIRWAETGPTVILVVGVNGSGKTTSIAKLSYRFRQELGKSVVLGAGDTFRAAAVEQLTVWSQRIGAEIVTGDAGSDPAAVAHRAVVRAKELQADVCLIDTAGRLQTQTNLMQQLEKVHRVIGKQIEQAPHEVLLVLDSTAGQNGLSQAQGFSEAAKCTGIVLTKFDGTAKGGVAIAIRQQFNLPVKFIGIGEKETDLEPFDVDSFVEALFDDVSAK
jgi:fused signal recognition particle receptor